MQLSESLISDIKTQKYILDRFLNEYTDSRDWKVEKGYNDMAKECYRLYRGIPIKKPKELEHQSNYFRPMTYSAVENTHPRIMAGLFSTDPWFRYLGMGDENIKNADNLGKLTYYKLMYEVPYYLQMSKAIKNALVYGWCLVYHPWLFQQKKRLININGKKQFMPFSFIDAPYCKTISIWDSYPEPGVDFIADGDRIMIREIISPSALLQRALTIGSPYILDNVYKILSKVEGVSFPEEDTQHFDELDSMMGLGHSLEKGTSKKIELLHRFGVGDLTKTGDDIFLSDMESWITVANRTQIVCAIPNPYDSQERPVEEIRPVPNTHGLIGIPMPQAGRDIQLEANDQMNFRLDQQNFIGNKVVKVKRNSDIYDKLMGGNVILYPGATLPVDDMDDLQELAFSGVDSSIYVDDTIMQNEYDKAVGVRELNSGQGDPRARTATGTSMLIRESNYRFDNIIKHVNPSVRNIMQKIGYMMQQLAINPGTGDKQQSIFFDALYPDKKKIMQFAYGDIQAKFMTMLLGSSTKGDRSYHFALLQSLKQLLINDPNINQAELDRQLLEEAELNNIDKLLAPVQAPPVSEAGGMGGPTETSLGPVVGGFKGGPTQDQGNSVNIRDLIRSAK